MPYRVWVSEIMLQQTQVATALPFFDRFMKSFPNIESLANTDEETLLSHWEGLGYYRRARSLHAAAKRIMLEHEGVFPSSFDEVVALPGIGRYTAGAILSISGNQKLPILEGNTQRVYARWIAMGKPVTDKDANRLLWEIAEAMLPSGRSKASPGEFNQAAMELGALVCTPRNPKCDECPIRPKCAAYRLGIQQQIPGKVKKIQYESRIEFAFVIHQKRGRPVETRYLMRPLPKDARWAGLWDFPRITHRSMDHPDEAAKDVSEQLGGHVVPGEQLTKIRHAVTKYRIELRVHHATIEHPWCDQSLPTPWRFVSLDEIQTLPLSSTGRKIANLLSSSSS